MHAFMRNHRLPFLILSLLLVVACANEPSRPTEEPTHAEPSREARPAPVAEAPYALPSLDFPLPAPSARIKLPATALAGSRTYGQLSDRLEHLLQSQGYFEMSYYLVPGGFALVSRLEQTDKTGKPLPDPDRWEAGIAPDRDFSLKEVLRALFFTDPGYFRILFFVLTDETQFTSQDSTMSRDEAVAIASGGALDLGSYRARPLPDVAKLYALVYEFEVNEARKETQSFLLVPGRIQGRTHLERAGLWQAFSAP
jgi:hypothetical protein